MARTGRETRAPWAGSNQAAAKGVICRADGDKQWVTAEKWGQQTESSSPGTESAFADRKVKEPPEKEAKGNRWADRLFLRRRYGSRQADLTDTARPGTLLL